ncbi:hypothetical protein H1O16_gp291 [Burkholderia phage BcepSaruman]|uniref:Uncharacterized protein n=1 Tax=Burkholderia phage BcepSaruman TaxID=2530032 RepID=A0A4D5ZCL8_9CAUD|nr:hypothetical protein H1O16_gp291 [Burkholderia phage BcepSaruman]QBX06704.1 hypothetical protein BcepSaruman_291 [Burkholderia phage BcepSaruman]
MDRKGFMRTLSEQTEFARTLHTCPEYGHDEWCEARAILRRAAKRGARLASLPYNRRLRIVLRELRRNKQQ